MPSIGDWKGGVSAASLVGEIWGLRGGVAHNWGEGVSRWGMNDGGSGINLDWVGNIKIRKVNANRYKMKDIQNNYTSQVFKIRRLGNLQTLYSVL